MVVTLDYYIIMKLAKRAGLKSIGHSFCKSAQSWNCKLMKQGKMKTAGERLLVACYITSINPFHRTQTKSLERLCY